MAVPPPPDLGDDEDRKPSRAKLTLWLAWLAGTALVALLVSEISGVESAVSRLNDDVQALEVGLDEERVTREDQNRNRRTETFDLAERTAYLEAIVSELQQYHP